MQSPYTPFEKDIALTVLKPLIAAVNMKYRPQSKRALLNHFREELQCRVSMRKFNQWLEWCGFSPSNKFDIGERDPNEKSFPAVLNDF